MKHWHCTTAAAALLVALSGAAHAQGSVNCDRNFTTADANSDGIISTAEATNASSKEFDRIDVDKSGSISKSEWQSCGDVAMTDDGMMGSYSSEEGKTTMASEAEPTTPANADNATAAKQNADQASASGSSTDGGTTGEATGSAPLSSDEDFAAADADRSGDVSRDEAARAAEQAFSESGPQSGQSQEDFARSFGTRFAMIDSDGDGSVSQDEWNNRDNAQIDALFSRLDANSDNQLSKSEYDEARNTSQSSGDPVTVWYYFVY